MNDKELDFRDVSAPVYLQARALSNISNYLSNGKEIDNGIIDLLDEFKSYNNAIDMDFIKNSIFNTTTCMYVLYFFVCCAKERNLISRYNLGEDRLCDVIATNYDIKMIDFTTFLRNAIAHLRFIFYENGNIDIYNNPKLEHSKIILDADSKVEDILCFLKNKKVKNININKNENHQYEIVEQKYTEERYTFTHKQFLDITAYYTEKFCKSIMHQVKK